jgi:hypothetical protein
VRLDDRTRERLDRVAAELSKRAAGAPIPRSEVTRKAIEHGLLALEKSLGLE